MAIRAGRMRARISIQCQSDSGGQYSSRSSWQDLYKDVRARKWLLRGGESNQASGEIAQSITRFSLRFNSVPNVHSLCRLIYNGDVYDITYVNNVDEKNHEVILDCVLISRLSTRGV